MKHVADILKAAGVQLSGEEDDDTVANAMTSWLGLSDEILAISDDSAVLTVDDCLPLSDAVYEAAADWLVAAWSGNNTSRFLSLRTTTTNATTTNPLLAEAAALSQNDDDGADKLISLEAAFESVRATKWLRAWLEFNVSDPLHLIADQSMSITSNNLSSSLSRQLLRVDAVDPNAQIINDGNKNNSSSDTTYHKVSIKNALIRALYKHVQDLPDLQQQMLSFSQYLQRADPHSMAVTPSGGGVLKDPNSRLRQYERAMAVSNQLHAEWQEHTFRLQCILGDVYAAGNPDQRKLCRRLLGHVWSTFVLQSSTSNSRSLRQENTKAAAIAMTLTVLRRILSGMMLSSDTLSDATHHLLFQQLIPLHKADGLVLWRDQTAVLELYHEPLCQCMALIFQRNVKQLIPSVLQQILQPNIFPVAGNTSKQVLLLHEVDSYLLLLVPTDGSSVAPMERSVIVSENTLYLKEERAMMQTLYQVLGRCMSSEHSRVAERALQFFQNASFEKLVFSRYLELGLHTLLPALVRREPSWNPTVRKMTYNVLKKLQGCIMFEPICNCIFSEFDAAELSSTRETATATISSNKVLTKATTIAASQMEEAAARRAMASSTSDFSLKTGMGSWRPTSAATLREPGSMPPPSARRPSHPSGAPGRGMAPWIQMPSIPGSIPSSVTPPLTVTGVAPWAMKPAAPPPTALGHKRVAPEVHLKEIGEEMNADDVEPIPRTGLEYVLTNMEKIKPPDEEEGVSSWSCAQMAETPTYLPHLKFHDLVFGHDLGSGAFGSVKYVRLIEKTKPRSQWPEYAVKVVSTEKIRALGYEASIQREIAVLRFLSHPGIARLVSSFRFHDGAYLVLEYASRGDLHTLLQKHGSLDIDSTRFVIGEVVAALASIHEMGFLFGDLKPENVVITEPGHIKLTDFGGCRPVTEEAKALIKTIAKDLLKNLRDGDWKARPPSLTSSSGYGSTSSNDAMDEDTVAVELIYDPGADAEEDVRIEGTTAYLPPEVVMGAFPTIAADAWALGCVTYQCLSGRPPLLEGDDEATRNRIVSFDFNESQSKSELDRLFEDKHAAGITAEARDMIKSLLHRDPSKRPGMNQLAEHTFFKSNVFALYSQPAYPLDVGTVLPAPSAQWARRQFSSIWAPQPASYILSVPVGSANSNAFSDPTTDSPIQEGEEALGFFSPSGKLSSTTSATVGKSTQRTVLPPL